MRGKKAFIVLAVISAALLLAGCGMTGSAIQGVGSAFNKTGGAVKNLGS